MQPKKKIQTILKFEQKYNVNKLNVNIVKVKIGYCDIYLSIGVGPDVGFRLRKALSHLVFMDVELIADNLRSAAVRGDAGSATFPRNRSFC